MIPNPAIRNAGRFVIAIAAMATACCGVSGCDEGPAPAGGAKSSSTAEVRHPDSPELGSPAPIDQARRPPTNSVPAPGTDLHDQAAVAQVADRQADRDLISNDSQYAITFSTLPEAVPLNESFALDIDIAPRSGGKMRADATLEVDAIMPEHGHGMNVQPAIKSLGGGRFRAEGLLFHMPGKWELHFDITRDGITSRAQTEIVLE